MSPVDVWYVISFFGAPELGLALAGFFFFLWLWLRRSAKRPVLKKFVFVYVVSLLIFLTFAFAMRMVYPMPRPCAGEPACPLDSSFPSGHAGTAFALATSSFLVFRKKAAPMFLYAILIAYSRLALGVHTILDVAVGAGLGIVLPVVLIWVYRRFFSKIKL